MPTSHRDGQPLLDPFSGSLDPAVYVSRKAADVAVEQLLAAVAKRAGNAVLIAPPGMGKTLLLQVVAARLESPIFRAYLPYAGLSPEELCGWALGQLGLPQTENPTGVLKAFGQHLSEEGSVLVLLIDDVDAMSAATARHLAELVADSKGAIRVLMASSHQAAARRAITAIAIDATVVELSEPMSEEETGRYIDGRLSLAAVAPATRKRFDIAVIRRLHRASSGIPGRLHALAAAELRRSVALDAVEPTAGVEELADDERTLPYAAVPSEAAPEVLEPDEPIPFDELLERPPELRLGAAPSQRNVLLGLVLLAALTVSIPLIRSLLPEARSQDAVRPVNVAPVARRAETAFEPAAEATPAPPSAVAPEPVAGLFQVQVNATPWASIRIDGVSIGDTPLAGITLLAGAHTFQARMADGRIIDRVVEIDADHRHISFE